MNLIAAVDGAWHIGLGNRTAYHLPQDLHHFRQRGCHGAENL